MLLFVTSFFQRRNAPLWLISLLLATTPGVWSLNGIIGQNEQEINRRLLDAFQTNKTDDILAMLAERRLQLDDNLTLVSDEVDIPDDGLPTPANGCTICMGTTFLPDNIPNQNLMKDFHGMTCRDWQYLILPEMVPNGEACRYNYFYQELFVSCCELPLPRYQCEQNVHDLVSSREYNIAVPPIVTHREPLVVTTEVNFGYPEDINVVTGTATMLAGIDMRWKDPRLAWTVDETTCADYINLWTGYNVQDTVIWVPDFDLMNQKEGVQGYPPSQATIFSDGTVQWNIYGTTTAMCQFKGLANIPYDILGCQLIFAARSRVNANLIAYKFNDYKTLRVANWEMQYNEFRPMPELFEKGYTYYANLDHPQGMYYNFYFQRAKNFYIWNILVPTIIFTYCSFFTYLLDMRVGERMGFGMALALVIVAAQIVTFDMIPISSRKLWIDKFVAWSFYWVLVVLLQSVLVGFLYFVREDYDIKEKEQQSLSTISEGSQRNTMENLGEEIQVYEDSNDADKLPSQNDLNVGTTGKSDEDHTSEKEENHVNDNQAPLKLKSKPWYLSFSIRKFDYICMVISIVSYTIFIISMFSVISTGAWLKDEPVWSSWNKGLTFTDHPNDVYDPFQENSQE